MKSPIYGCYLADCPKEKMVVGEQKTRGLKSLTAMLILVICILVSVPTIGLACLGIYDLKKSMDESVELYEESMTDGYSMEIKSQAQGAANQANETETVNEKMVELGGVIEIEKNGVEKLGEAVSLMTKYSSGASESIMELGRIAKVTIDTIDVVSKQTNKNNDSAANITKAIEIIKGLANQTNLLSLNASIEAARGGRGRKGVCCCGRRNQESF